MSLWLRIRAPFAAFRWMQAGVYRSTSPVIPPSAAWGLVLNLAHIESRADGDDTTTLVRGDAPPLRLAIGTVNLGEISTLYQQLHSYPVGSSGKDLKERTHGQKYWIAPVRREFLVGFDAMIGIDSDSDELLSRIRLGLAGELGLPRYGLPFAGDNNLLIDHIDIVEEPPPTRWYEQLERDSGPRAGSCRLTVRIDRGDSAKTTSPLFAPTLPQVEVPRGAWTWVPREP